MAPLTILSLLVLATVDAKVIETVATRNSPPPGLKAESPAAIHQFRHAAAVSEPLAVPREELLLGPSPTTRASAGK